MRELKFRAWGKNIKEYMSQSFDGEVEIANVTRILGDLIDQGSWIIEQYTGLKDKNGKEIYEGDIVRYGDQVLGVKFDEMKDSDCSYYYLGWAMGDLSLCEHNTMVEVIGNIHENPELLGGEE